jgi:hypothetical protein
VVSTDKIGPVTVAWAFIVGVDDLGRLYFIDHEYVTDVKAKRIATLDDIYSAAAVAQQEKAYGFFRPSEDAYAVAFLVLQSTDGYIAASPDIFENVVPASNPGNAQVLGAFAALQGQIIAQKTLDAMNMQSYLAASAAETARRSDPDASKKTAGGLYVA